MSAESPVVTLRCFRWCWRWTWSWTRLLLAEVRWTAFPRLQGRDLFRMFMWSTGEYLMVFFVCGRLFERGHGLSVCWLCYCINSCTAFSEESRWQFSWFTFLLRSKTFFQYFPTDLDSVVIHNYRDLENLGRGRERVRDFPIEQHWARPNQQQFGAKKTWFRRHFYYKVLQKCCLVTTSQENGINSFGIFRSTKRFSYQQ